jgi:hypothetical protein
VPDASDNCLLTVNADERDTNGDGIGNACDADFNGDCVQNFLDLGVMKAAFFTVGDTDTDLDGDGITNFSDLAVLKGAFLSGARAERSAQRVSRRWHP